MHLGEKIRSLESWLVLLSGWPRSLAALLAGAISALALAPFDAFYVLFLTIPVFAWLIDGAASEPDSGFGSRLWEGFKPGFFFGFGYFLAGLWWIGSAFLVDTDAFLWALPIAILAVPAMLAVFWGCATAIARLFWTGEISRIFMLGACLMLFEYFRSFVATGLPWNSLAYAAYFNPVTMQIASVLGTYAMTPFIILVCSLALFIFPTGGERLFKHKFAIFLCLSLIGLQISFGFLRLHEKDDAVVDNVRLRLMQPAIDQKDKFDRKKETELVQNYLDLSVTENNGTKLSDATHLIWPESAFPFLLTERRDALAAIAAMLPQGTSLITGAARAEQAGSAGKEDLVFNSMYVVDHEGLIVAAADKVHLVPFGEYLPLQSFAESLGLQQLTQVQGGFSAGSSRKLLSTGTGPEFLPLICYEVIFSGNILGDGKRPQWILNLTNDAWFGFTPGPYQHERQAILRAVEEGMPLVRVANTGVSGIYNSFGEPVARLELGKQGVLDSSLPIAFGPTVFSVNGKAVFWSIFFLFFTVGIIPVRKS